MGVIGTNGTDVDDPTARSAIVEHEAGAPRPWADGYARLLMMPRPESVPPTRWATFLDDAGRFIDRWSRQAEALGWTVEQVFGTSATAPTARYDCAGLVWMLSGRPLVALTAEAATIEDRGALLRIFGKPVPPETVTAWEVTS